MMRAQIERAILAQDVAIKARGVEMAEKVISITLNARALFEEGRRVRRRDDELYEKGLLAQNLDERFATSMRAQEKKQDILAELREDIQALRKHPDKALVVSSSAATVEYRDDKEPRLFKEGDDVSLLEGDLWADGWWGIEYNLAATVPVAIRKRYLFERAKRRIAMLFNKQLWQFGFGGEGSGVRMQVWNTKLHERGGNTAERLVFTFLTRVGYASGLFRVSMADAVADKMEKCDLIIERLSVPQNEELARTLGVNVTVVLDDDILADKQEKINRTKNSLSTVDDIVLVQLPIRGTIRDMIERWKGEGMPSGGPERYLDDAQKVKILAPILLRLFTPAEIKERFGS